MPTPIMITTGTSAMGDIITGTAPTFLVNGLPVATIGSPASGAGCVGVIVASTAVTTLINGLPVADITSTIAGANPITGVPVTLPAVMSSAVTFIV